MLTDAIEIMKFLSCPSCHTKSIDTYLLEQLKFKQHIPTYANLKPYDDIENNNGTISSATAQNTSIHLYLTCGFCKFTIKIINKDWLRIFYSHAFGV